MKYIRLKKVKYLGVKFMVSTVSQWFLGKPGTSPKPENKTRFGWHHENDSKWKNKL